jgi:hypothetical protein
LAGAHLLIAEKVQPERSLGSHAATIGDSIQRPIGFQQQLLGSLHADTRDGFMQCSLRHAAEALFEFPPRDMQFCRHTADPQRFCSMFADELRRKIDVAVFQ